MSNKNKQNLIDRKKLARKTEHLVVPPRMEGKVKNARQNPIKKRKK